MPDGSIIKQRIPHNFTPRELGQKSAMRYFDNGGLRGVYTWPRRYGKDLTFTHQTHKLAQRRVGMYLHMLPNHKQARKVIWDGFTNEGVPIIDAVFPGATRISKNDTEMKIRLRSGSLWQLVGSDYYDSIVGANPAGLVMSEAALSDPRAWNYFRPMLAGNGGWAAFFSTPRGYNWFYDLLKYAKTDIMWDWSHLTAYETQHIDASVLESERRQMPDELFRQEYLCDFSAANVGAIFGKYIEAAERQGRIVESLPFDPVSDVVISSDIGRRDKSAWVWWRVMQGGYEVFDYDEGTGMDAEEWIDRLSERMGFERGIDGGWKSDEKLCAAHLYLPHDARAKNFQSRFSAIETFLKKGKHLAKNIICNAQRKKADSINAARKVLRVTRFDGVKCDALLDAMRFHHYKYDEEERIFSSEPDHDWSSHACDAYMEGAAVLHDYVAPPPPPEPAKQYAEPLHYQFKLDDLWKTVGPSQGPRRV
jgi:hypothetical protein